MLPGGHFLFTFQTLFAIGYIALHNAQHHRQTKDNRQTGLCQQPIYDKNQATILFKTGPGANWKCSSK